MIQPYLLIAESELHAGAGKVEGKAIDNPIQREKGTRFPKVEGSGFRGAVKASLRRKSSADWTIIEELFGKDPETDENQKMGLLKLDVASLLLMPVYSPTSALTYYITAPIAIERWIRSLQNYGLDIKSKDLKFDLAEDECLAFTDTILFKDTHALIAEYALKSLNHGENPLPIPTIYGEAINTFLSDSLYPKIDEENDPNRDLREITSKRIVIVPNLFFSHMVQYKTAVHVGNSIDATTGVVKEGALFSVEYLPQGSVLTTAAHTLEPMDAEKYPEIKTADKAMTKFEDLLKKTNNFFSMGGKSSIGKGHIKMEKIIIKGLENDNN